MLESIFTLNIQFIEFTIVSSNQTSEFFLTVQLKIIGEIFLYENYL